MADFCACGRAAGYRCSRCEKLVCRTHSAGGSPIWCARCRVAHQNKAANEAWAIAEAMLPELLRSYRTVLGTEPPDRKRHSGHVTLRHRRLGGDVQPPCPDGHPHCNPAGWSGKAWRASNMKGRTRLAEWEMRGWNIFAREGRSATTDQYGNVNERPATFALLLGVTGEIVDDQLHVVGSVDGLDTRAIPWQGNSLLLGVDYYESEGEVAGRHATAERSRAESVVETLKIEHARWS